MPCIFGLPLGLYLFINLLVTACHRVLSDPLHVGGPQKLTTTKMMPFALKASFQVMSAMGEPIARKSTKPNVHADGWIYMLTRVFPPQ